MITADTSARDPARWRLMRDGVILPIRPCVVHWDSHGSRLESSHEADTWRQVAAYLATAEGILPIPLATTKS